MLVSKSKKQHHYKLFHRNSLLVHLKSKRHSRHRLYSSEERFKKISRIRHFVNNFYQTYRSLCLFVTFILRLCIVIDRIIRELSMFIEKLIQIIRVIYGWIQMIRSIFSAIHLIMSRIMMLSHCIHRICHLLTILLQPFSNRTFEKAVRSFSHFVFYYYSSNGACYTLQARTRHIVGRVRARWKKKRNYIIDDGEEEDDDDDNDIYYDAYSEEC
ncbi:unnamed protein product [Rotaria sp. Silwood1]|nr:unnamed protein product [Rotaria sp. Silwood1]CAF0743730.1 unnamed protein product [Rotaria sp. Silwood1]CAF3346893.1 unnamed protein product [Rotaria sp. Silwood1]CAF3350931.1 unnamed protein product [Rotaria sp. Silwood1]CAF5120312.1 unnamed protein product [Rotaria sp. Silwood1]